MSKPTLNPRNILNHLAIIMDGNSRWAEANAMDKFYGYTKGAEQVRTITEESLKLGIKHLTLYAFSVENWSRPKEDVSYLLHLLELYINQETANLNAQNIKLKFIGDLSKLSQELHTNIKQAVEITKNNNALTLYIAFGYGGRNEILDACKAAINYGIKDIDSESLRQYLYCPEMPDVDFLIRTGKEQRMSNFLLWQTAYTELYFSDKFWPEFTIEDLHYALDDFKNRKRNFGHAR
jgi:undecaprenyl diphosphate synthase